MEFAYFNIVLTHARNWLEKAAKRAPYAGPKHDLQRRFPWSCKAAQTCGPCLHPTWAALDYLASPLLLPASIGDFHPKGAGKVATTGSHFSACGHSGYCPHQILSCGLSGVKLSGAI